MDGIKILNWVIDKLETTNISMDQNNKKQLMYVEYFQYLFILIRNDNLQAKLSPGL
jgi:hypothetical protein